MLIAAVSQSVAQPYWSPAQMDSFGVAQRHYLAHRPVVAAVQEFPDTFRYSWPVQFEATARFLRTWQLVAPDSNENGGLIEAESGDLRTVIQSDNTQEALWDWSRHAEYFGGDTFRVQVDRAWDYLSRYPGYAEEIDGYSHYYRFWNSALGLLAESGFRNAFHDSSMILYGDQCADTILHTMLPFTHSVPYYANLHPLVTALVAGELYQYGLERDRADWRNYALVLADSVKRWVEADPSRLSNTVWAMSGGTAIWGLSRSYFVAHPDSAGPWLDRVMPSLPEFYAPPDSYDVWIWDDSWNIWLANAYRAANTVHPAHPYDTNYRALIGYLIAQDRDHDGGIMASAAHPPTEDMSWISAYLIWMGLDGALDTLPMTDVGILSVSLERRSVHPDIPLIFAGDSLTPAIVVANFGRGPFFGELMYDWSSTGVATFALDLGRTETLRVGEPQVALSGDDWPFRAVAYAVGDPVRTNDSIRMTYSVPATVTTSVSSLCPASEGWELESWLRVAGEEYLWSTASAASGESVAILIPVGDYRFIWYALFPYGIDTTLATISADGPLAHEQRSPDVVTIRSLADTSYQGFFSDNLPLAGRFGAYWSAGDLMFGVVTDLVNRLTLVGSPTVVLWTGDDPDPVFGENVWHTVLNYMAQGGPVLLTGQNLAESAEGGAWLTENLGLQRGGESRSSMLYPLRTDSLGSRFDKLATGGTGSARNQTSRDILQLVSPIPAGVEIVPWVGYDSTLTQIAAVRGTFGGIDTSARFVVCGFGTEAVGQLGSNPRYATQDAFYRAVLDWLQGVTGGVAERPRGTSPARITAWPNPTRDVLVVRGSPDPLVLWDLLGQPVANISWQRVGSDAWETRLPESMAAGVYYIRSGEGTARVIRVK